MKASRRNFLKIAVFGGAAVLLGRLFGSALNFWEKPESKSKESEKEFKNFNVTETKEELIFKNKLGEEILVIEKEGI